MAPQANRLADIGREGFDLVDRFYGGGTSNQVPKKQYNAPQQYAPDHSNQTVIDSKKAAKKYKGVAGYLDAHVSSNQNIINNNKAAEIYGGVVITEYYKKRFVGYHL
ncbi:hypothetical protein NL676_020722 [Syzygium grande]|nr:hypothetical protein NL676_020722 [Syzygium grande]